MTRRFRCPDGHEWQLAEADDGGSVDPPRCPVCRQLGETISVGVNEATLAYSAEASASATVAANASPGGASSQLSIAGYQILDELGRGGMGVVYKARQVALDRIVALKMLLTGTGASTDELARFHAEAQSAANLRHPNIVPIYEVGEQGGRHYFSMAYVEGESAAQRARRSPPSATQAAEWVKDVAQAIHFAHEHGILHRDLKPSNILIDAHGVPLVTDFGLAKQLESHSELTATGTVLGTPSYMPPEQAQGRHDLIGPASDVYALGATLYDLLTGRPPFRAATQVETLRQVIDADPAPPRLLNPQVPRDLETICLKCLQKAPGKRYATAAALAEDLQRFLTGEPIHARRISLAERCVKWVRRRPTAAALLAVVILAILGLTLTGFWYSQRLREAYAQNLVDTLIAAEIAEAPRLIEELAGYRRWADPLLYQIIEDSPVDSRQRLHASLAVLPRDPGQVNYLCEQLLVARPDAVMTLATSLHKHGGQLAERFRRELIHPQIEGGRRLRAACAVATFDPNGPSWNEDICKEVANQMVAENPLVSRHWVEALRPVGKVLFPSLRQIFKERHRSQEGSLAASILAEYADHDPQLLVSLIREADPRQVVPLARKLRPHAERALALLHQVLDEDVSPLRTASLGEASRFISSAAPDGGVDPNELRDELTRLHARALLALLCLDHDERIKQALQSSENPRLRTYLIHQIPLAGFDADLLVEEFDRDQDGSVRQALLLSLGEYSPSSLPPSKRDRFIEELIEAFHKDGDPGVHSAIDWLLRRWGFAERVEDQERRLRGQKHVEGCRWYVNNQGMTFAIIPGPVELLMGSPQHEWNRNLDGGDERQHRRRIGRTFAIGTKEVTLAQLQRFVEQCRPFLDPAKHYRMDWASRSLDSPANNLNWYEAVKFCRWLSEQEKIPRDQMCYPPLEDIKEAMQLPADYLQRTGYRLPTEGEWEYACRAGAITPYGFGSDLDLLPHYAWCQGNARHRMWPVGTLKPNDLGLFDMHGNCFEWCAGPYLPLPGPLDQVVEDVAVAIGSETAGVLRGGDFAAATHRARSAHRLNVSPSASWPASGLRLARTLATPPVDVFQQSARHQAEYRIVGSGARFTINDVQGGVAVTPEQGKTPAVVKVAAPDRRTRPFSFVVNADTGPSVKTAGVLFSSEWKVTFHSWKPPQPGDTRPPANWQEVVASKPLDQFSVGEIDFYWGDAPSPKVPADYFAVVATTELELPEGTYEVWLLSDDGSRLFVDGKKVLDTWPGSLIESLRRVRLSAGKHTLRIEYYDLFGYAELRFGLRPVN